MEVRPGANPADVKNYDTDRLRHDFLIQNLFVADEIKTIYSQIDRIIVGAATPAAKTGVPSLIDIKVLNPPKLQPQIPILFLSTYSCLPNQSAVST